MRLARKKNVLFTSIKKTSTVKWQELSYCICFALDWCVFFKELTFLLHVYAILFYLYEEF